MDDDALVRQILAGHPEAYAELVRRWAGRITALCHARLGRSDLAEELAQETLVRGLEELPSLSDPSRFGPWLAGIASRTCRDWLSTHANGHAALHLVTCEVSASELAESTGESTRDDPGRLLRAIDELPEELRVVVHLFYYQKMSYRDLARLLDVSTSTVNTRLTEARRQLREQWRTYRGIPAPPEPPRQA